MYTRIGLAVLLLWCVGCTPNAGSSLGSGRAQSAASFDATAGSFGESALAARSPASGHHSFASLPDRGALVAYPAKSVVRHDGAYTWHRADLSEAHALRAIVTGAMEITTPSGEALKFRYERHVEHPSGDLTWVGRLQGGQQSDEVILTFGEKAVFGSIAQRGKPPLRLTMSDGASWLVETDPSKIAGINNEATRPRKPDYLVPPKAASGWQAFSDTSFVSSSAAPVTATAAATATTVVDVLIGYTAGFAAANNGAPLTRLNNMVETTNQAYINSGVDSRARLVHAMQVDYPDNTDNGTALEEMTGFKAPSTQTTPAAAFNALRAAREQYGADLVSLVRKFNAPENSGCGIAWLIGGGQSGIDSRDEFFGYSVVSDGRDVDTDGKTYLCREETLAHELGHNMGSQHDIATATFKDTTSNGECHSTTVACPHYGAYPYSFGYKTSVGSGNFYTVMAYGDSGQTNYRIFSNPQSDYCGGQLCGTASADNARTLRQTIPLVSTFRATVVPQSSGSVRNDLDGDGKSDIYWRNMATGANDVWIMDGTVLRNVATVYREPNQAWTIAGSGDFNGDGRADIFWRNTQTGQTYIQLMDGFRIISSGFSFTVSGPAWKVVAFGDFNADGKIDIYWRNSSTGFNDVWLMDGTSQPATGTVYRESNQSWRVVGAGDFNGDGFADIFWRNTATGQNYIHLMAGMTILSGSGNVTPVASQSWQVVEINDFNGDGRADLYWRNSANGENHLWTMDGLNPVAINFVYVESNQAWKIVNSGDYNGDGKADILWRNAQTGANYVQLMRGAQVLAGSSLLTVADTNWQVTGF